MFNTTTRTLLHPLTGDPIVPIGRRRDGSPIWPIMGADDGTSEAAAKAAADKVIADKAAADATAKAAADKATAEELAKIEGLGDKGKQAILREREAHDKAKAEVAAEKKRADAAEAKVKAFEDSQKTAEQLAAETLETTTKSSTENAALVLKFRVAAEKGLSLSAAERLRGSTKEELEADADELKKLLGAGTGSGRPRPDLSQGGGGGGGSEGGSVSAGRDLHSERHNKKK